MKTLKPFIYYLFIFFISVACETIEEGDEIYNTVAQDNGKASIKFQPTSTFWYYRTQPDSVVIEIKDGIPPYIIIDKPNFSANAQIKGNQLLLFPMYNFNSTQTIGFDFVNIQDNYGNVNTLNIEVGSLTNNYRVDSIWFKLVGDTTIVFDGFPVPAGSRYASWDEFYQNFGISVQGKNGGYLDFNANTIQHTKQNPPDKIRYLNLNISFPNTFQSRFVMVDTNQTINYTTLSKNTVVGNFNITVEDLSPNFQNNFNLEAFFSVSTN